MLRTQEELNSVAERGDAHYHARIKHLLTEDDKGRFVAIDANTGEWEISDGQDAADRLRERVPNADIHLIRHITYHTVSFGYFPLEQSE